MQGVLNAEIIICGWDKKEKRRRHERERGRREGDGVIATRRGELRRLESRLSRVEQVPEKVNENVPFLGEEGHDVVPEISAFHIQVPFVFSLSLTMCFPSSSRPHRFYLKLPPTHGFVTHPERFFFSRPGKWYKRLIFMVLRINGYGAEVLCFCGGLPWNA